MIFATIQGRIYVHRQCTVRHALDLAFFILDLKIGGWRLPLQYSKIFFPYSKNENANTISDDSLIKQI